MQKSLIFFAIVLSSLFSHQSLAQSFTVCENSEVIFEIEEGFWGEPVFEFSPDSLTWQEIDVNLNESFPVSEGMSGYYRLKMVDSDCDSSYISQVTFIETSEFPDVEFYVNSFFSNSSMLSTTDPFIWYTGDSLLTDILVFVGQNTYEINGFGVVVDNPGENFSVFATALHSGTNCTVYSDTLNLNVIELNGALNVIWGVSQIDNLSTAIAETSTDSISVQSSTEFQINYASALGHDFLWIYDVDSDPQEELFAICVVPQGTEEIEVTTELIAIGLVMSHPSLALNLWSEFDEIQDLVISDFNLPTLEMEVEDQLSNNGYFEPQSSEIQLIVEEIIGNVLNAAELGFFGFGQANHMRNQDLVPSIASSNDGNMAYDPDSLKIFYIARAYMPNQFDSESIGLPISNHILMPGANSSVLQSSICIEIFNALAVFDAESFEFLILNPNFSRKIKPSDLNSPIHTKFFTKLVNGSHIDDGSSEYNVARQWNNFYFGVRYVLSIPTYLGPLLDLIGLGNVNTAFSSLMVVSEILMNSELTTADEVEMLIDLYLQSIPIVGSSQGAYSAYEDITNYANQLSSSQPQIYFQNTRLGPRLSQVLKVEKTGQSLIGGQGYQVEPTPYFRIKEYKHAFMHAPYGYQTLLETDTVDYQHYFSEGSNGSNWWLTGTLNGSSIEISNTASESITFTADFEDQFVVNDGANNFKWQLPWFENPAEIADIEFKFKVSWNDNGAYGNFTVAEMGGLDENNKLGFEASIEPFILEEVSGNDQFAQPNTWAEEPYIISVRTQSTNGAQDGFVVNFEVLEGNGWIREVNGSDESDSLEIETTTFLQVSGLAAVEWKFVDQGPQVLKASIINPETNEEVASTFLNGTAVDCPDLEANIGDDCDDGNQETANSSISDQCECVTFDCSSLEANFGDDCDDGNPETSNDTITENCECIGEFDCPDLEANIGDPCDDGDPSTTDETVGNDCSCNGTVLPSCGGIETPQLIIGNTTVCSGLEDVVLPDGAHPVHFVELQWPHSSNLFLREWYINNVPLNTNSSNIYAPFGASVSVQITADETIVFGEEPCYSQSSVLLDCTTVENTGEGSLFYSNLECCIQNIDSIPTLMVGIDFDCFEIGSPPYQIENSYEEFGTWYVPMPAAISNNLIGGAVPLSVSISGYSYNSTDNDIFCPCSSSFFSTGNNVFQFNSCIDAGEFQLIFSQTSSNGSFPVMGEDECIRKYEITNSCGNVIKTIIRSY